MGLDEDVTTAMLSWMMVVVVMMMTIMMMIGWRGGLVVGRRTCDLRVAGSRTGCDAAAQQP